MDILAPEELIHDLNEDTGTIIINKDTNFGKPLIFSDKNITQEFIEITLEEFED